MAKEVKLEEKKQSKTKAYLAGVKAERKKIIWPDRKTVRKYTGVVVGLSILVSLIIFALDNIFNFLMSKLIAL